MAGISVGGGKHGRRALDHSFRRGQASAFDVAFSAN
jgi:hypothetical protein